MSEVKIPIPTLDCGATHLGSRIERRRGSLRPEHHETLCLLGSPLNHPSCIAVSWTQSHTGWLRCILWGAMGWGQAGPICDSPDATSTRSGLLEGSSFAYLAQFRQLRSDSWQHSCFTYFASWTSSTLYPANLTGREWHVLFHLLTCGNWWNGKTSDRESLHGVCTSLTSSPESSFSWASWGFSCSGEAMGVASIRGMDFVCQQNQELVPSFHR